MADVSSWLEYFYAHPVIGVGVAAAVLVAVFLLNRKPRYVRDADEHLKVLRKDRSEKYRDLRPL
jgi:hypothetical protein